MLQWVPNPLDTLDSLRGKQVDADDVNYNEQFLLHTGQGGRLLEFRALTELAFLFQSEYLVGDGRDGTFDMATDTAYQVNAVFSYAAEQFTILTTLLADHVVQSLAAQRKISYLDIGTEIEAPKASRG